MPTPIAVYFASGTANETLVLGPGGGTFTPSNGEYWTVLSASWDTGAPTGVPTGGGQTYTAKKTVAPGGFNGYCRIDECAVSGSPGAMSVSVPPPSGNTRHSAALIRWPAGCSGGAVNSTVSGTGAPSANVTTTAANSGIAQVSVDVASQDPATRAFRNSATEAGILDGHVGSNSVQYHAYVTDIGAVGTYAIGLTAPGSQTWVEAALEVKPPAGISQAISAATEADTALPIGRLRSRTLGTAISTEVALPIGRRKTRPVGTATETDLAMPLSGYPVAAVGQPVITVTTAEMTITPTAAAMTIEVT